MTKQEKWFTQNKIYFHTAQDLSRFVEATGGQGRMLVKEVAISPYYDIGGIQAPWNPIATPAAHASQDDWAYELLWCFQSFPSLVPHGRVADSARMDETRAV